MNVSFTFKKGFPINSVPARTVQLISEEDEDSQFWPNDQESDWIHPKAEWG
jgi:hypothetical protein